MVGVEAEGVNSTVNLIMGNSTLYTTYMLNSCCTYIVFVYLLLLLKFKVKNIER